MALALAAAAAGNRHITAERTQTTRSNRHTTSQTTNWITKKRSSHTAIHVSHIVTSRDHPERNSPNGNSPVRAQCTSKVYFEGGNPWDFSVLSLAKFEMKFVRKGVLVLLRFPSGAMQL